MSLSAAEPASSSTGPLLRSQPRQTDGARVAANYRVSRPSITKKNPFVHIAAKWRVNLQQNQPDPSTRREESLPLPDKAEFLTLPPAPTTPSNDKLAGSEDEKDEGEDYTVEESRGPACYVAPPLSTLTIGIALPGGKLPTNAAIECAAQNPSVGDPRIHCGWAATDFHWSATCLRHRPLYFEQVNAERYGYSVCGMIQPVISGGHFFFTIAALPYKMAVECPRDCLYALGHYRPGSCTPRRFHRIPLEVGATIVEVGLIAGLILLIP